jgi:hypothetical protein
MRRTVHGAIAVLILGVGSGVGSARAGAQSQELIRGYLGGGVSAPIGSLGNYVDPGYNILLGVSWRAPFSGASVRVDAMFAEFTQTSGLASSYTQMVSGNLNGQYLFALGALAPYVFGGPGYYFLRGDNIAAVAWPRPTTNRPPYQSSHFGIDGGAGVRYQFRVVSVFLEGRDDLVFIGHAQRQYVPFTAGISLPYPWGQLGVSGVQIGP